MSAAHIDFRTMPSNIPSLCIPRVFANIGEVRIRRTFGDLDLGDIERVDIVSKTTDKGEKYNRVFVHFRRWSNSANANAARERLLNGKEIKIIYDEPWFWKISAYRETARRPDTRPQQTHKTASIEFDVEEVARRPVSPQRRPRDNRVPRDPRNDKAQRDTRNDPRPRDTMDRPYVQNNHKQYESNKKTNDNNYYGPREQPKLPIAPALSAQTTVVETTDAASVKIANRRLTRKPGKTPSANEKKPLVIESANAEEGEINET
jgi:hypothetical protein